MRKIRLSLVKGILSGVLFAAAIPPTLYWGWDYAYASASASSVTLHSISEMTGKLTHAMNNRNETIMFTFEGNTSNLKSQVQSAIDKSMESDNYLHYIVDSYAFSYRGSSRSAKVTVEIKYLENLQQTAYVTKEVKAALSKIIKPGMNNHEKVRVIHDWVVLHLKYDNSYRKYTAYEGLQSGSAVCQGYSLLTYKMLKEAGINNRIVEGTARPEGGRSQSHAWNLVQLDGRWYHLDTTWDDPSPDQAGAVSTAYYLRTDNQMRADHTWNKPYPAASVAYHLTLSELIKNGGEKKNFYLNLQQQLNYALYDETKVVTSAAGILTLAKEAVNSGEDSVLFRYRGNKVLLKNDLKKLYEIGLDNLSYTTSAFDNTGDLKVYVTWK
ncbi:transglutaminase domain-containing protein [Paenibacillus wynnii]|uniref:Transglutaminase n=1 Tax=Paenibacillus wynnii TaxID=268407 RepID=A0A098MG00_9BACL|nr:transglutaminase domain-containing protein [Paenibacillus wynnii]KGE20981.1 transglutaminase [Paenibacillus wynnii]